MEIMLIILFFILILVCTSRAEIRIEKLEIVKSKVKFLIKVKFYIFKYILIFSKKIKKKDILKLIDISSNKENIEKGTAIAKKVPMELVEFNLDLNYGWRHIYTNIYAYALLNALIPIFLYKYSNPQTKIKYNITTDFKRMYLYLKLSAKIRIKAIKIIRHTLKSKKKI